MRILHVLGALDTGGIEVMVMNLYRAVDRSSVQFDFVIHTEKRCFFENEIEQLGGRVFRITSFRGYNAVSYKKAWNAFFADHPGEFAAVHGHMGSSAAFYLSAAKRVGIHTIAHSHGSTRFINGKAVAYAFFSYWTRFVADAFFACSLVAGQDRFGQRVAGSDRFRLVMNAFTVEKFAYSEQERHAVRKSLGLQDAFVIGHVGRFDIPKNHSFLLQVFSEVVAHHHEARLLLVGDGERRDAVERLIQELDLQDSVILLGMRQDVPSLLQAMDVFVFPSLVEGLGVSLVEAQACGLPCVASDRVPEEAKVTELVTFLSLSDPYAVWVDEICRVKGNSERKNRKGDVKAAGYDILDSAKALEQYYRSLV